MIRIAFLGTPQAAVPALDRLARLHETGLVVTQPDRPRGRSGAPRPSPVKQRALELGIAVAQPETKASVASALSERGPFDLAVVVAYGRMLTAEALAVPRAGALNAHFSLLPRWRGAAPVARALMEGDSMTGVTVIKLDEGLDTGPVLTAQAVDVAAGENAGELTARLAGLGAGLLASSIPAYLAGELIPAPQSGEGVAYAPKITSADRPLDLGGSLEGVINKVRGLAPAPGATLRVDGEPHRILAARPHDHVPAAGAWEAVDGAPVVSVGGEGVEITAIQPPGKKPMSGDAWLRGRRSASGAVA